MGLEMIRTSFASVCFAKLLPLDELLLSLTGVQIVYQWI